VETKKAANQNARLIQIVQHRHVQNVVQASVFLKLSSIVLETISAKQVRTAAMLLQIVENANQMKII